jgi:hypothetical protein
MPRLTVYDTFEKRNVELTTNDILEAGAVANELLFQVFTEEQLYYAAGRKDSISDLFISGTEDSRRTVQYAERYLQSGHGIALRRFFQTWWLNPERLFGWVTAAVVIDFALNPPLPPIADSLASPLRWRDIYPPARFVLAAEAAPRIKRLSTIPTGADITAYQDALADATGLSPVPRSHPLDIRDEPHSRAKFQVGNVIIQVPNDPPGLPDFAAIRDNDALGETLATSGASYYTFLLWSQVQLWRVRRMDPRIIVAPGVVVLETTSENRRTAGRINVPELLTQLLTRAAFAPPLMTTSEGNLQVPLGCAGFGNWFARSVLHWGSVRDLILGCGPPDDKGLPAKVTASMDMQVRADLARVLGEDPYVEAPDRANATN